jgi:putative transcriptional regulator
LTTTTAVKHTCHDKLALQDGVLNEAQRTVVVRGSGSRRPAGRGQRDRGVGPAGQLDAGPLGGLAAGGDHRGDLAARYPPLPAAPPPGQVARGGRAAMKNLVRALRIEKGLAQGELAEAMGVSRQTINSIENERYTPSLPLALTLARYFGTSVEEMFDDQG